MKTARTIRILGQLPARFEEGFAYMAGDLGLARDDGGFPVTFRQGPGLVLETDAQGARIVWSKPVECFRGLSLLAQHWGETVSLVQKPCFETLGIMFDCSRNAVLKPETLRYFFRKMAMLGMDLGMMYTEDTYEVEGYPYFGYLRGR